jgi:hypothetical protein
MADTAALTYKSVKYTNKNKPSYTQKSLQNAHDNAIAIYTSTPELTHVPKKLSKQRKDYKDMVASGICNIHKMLQHKIVKHNPYFKCDIRKTLLCRHCGHKGHMDFECKLMNTSMKEQAKGSPLGFYGHTSSHKWHGTSNYNVTYKMKVKRFSPMNLDNNKSASTLPSISSATSIKSNKTVKKQPRGIKKQRIEGKWETYSIPELIKLLKDHNVLFGTKGLFHRGTPHARLVELAYEYIKTK